MGHTESHACGEYVRLEQSSNALGNKNPLALAMGSCQQASFDLIQQYKQAEDKQAFKQQHYEDFKRFDIAKKQMYILKSKYNIKNEEEFRQFQEDLRNTRTTMYQTFNEQTRKHQQYKKQTR